MGIFIDNIEVAYYSGEELLNVESPVLSLSKEVINNVLSRNKEISFEWMITSTSAPDKLAPSLGHEIKKLVGSRQGFCIDIIQGCAGGVNSLVLASELAAAKKCNVLVVCADAARQSVIASNPLRKNFCDGAFACIVKYVPDSRGLIFSFSQQYEELKDIVQIRLGHYSKSIINKNDKSPTELIDRLGFDLDNNLVWRMVRKSKEIAIKLKEENLNPDLIITHFPNLKISKIISDMGIFQSNQFVDLSEVGNAGVATVGFGLNKINNQFENKKILLVGFGTGGVVSCGCWQF